ncbi:uncharacterized protein BJ171DRAFT_565548 [Polychytrium aggregatum]|uniref:uncharacterized protein n=1 Tax=Polychytrium aggregatum TaxID=110093 RepID=UPI0022FED629|nr:uncharacterized protein BJ171DRAFT_565548 [Polychytrium aggregatum]KAI9207770.1 hypothetical protein BJ171DRAFT_565548 [Polychytrium aggregatum]
MAAEFWVTDGDKGRWKGVDSFQIAFNLVDCRNAQGKHITLGCAVPFLEFDLKLPVEVILKIFSKVETITRCRAACVSRRWRLVLYSAPDLWLRLDLSRRDSLGGEKYLYPTETASQLQFLLVDSSLSRQRFSQLNVLDLSCTDIGLDMFSDPSILGLLQDTLARLILNGCPYVDSGSLFHLRWLRALKWLDISHCEHMDDFGIEVITFYLPQLNRLDMAYCFKITEKGIAKLFKLTGLTHVNLMGCYRIKNYPWATRDGPKKNTLSLKEIMIGEDSRMQKRGLWLLWCTWNWDMGKLISLCPFIETLHLNVVLLEGQVEGLTALLTTCPTLKNLSIVVDRNSISVLIAESKRIEQLARLEVTIHIGVTIESLSELIKSRSLTKLKALRFHSKHTPIFNDELLGRLIAAAPGIESLEMNGDDMTSSGLIPIGQYQQSMTSLLIHHATLSNEALNQIGKLGNLKELTITDLQEESKANQLSQLVACLPRSTRKAKALMRQINRERKAASRPLQPRLPQRPMPCPMSLPIGGRLKKLELASHQGFSDADLAGIVRQCALLQWVDFSFSFTFPKTMAALVDSCSGMLYVRLCRLRVVPALLSNSPSNRSTSAGSRRLNSDNEGSGVSNRANRSYSLLLDDNGMSRTDSSTPSFLASSEECQALVHFGKSAPPLLRVLDFTGDIGLTDWTLGSLANLPSLHTLFLDSCNHISSKSLVGFAEKTWKKLKRLYVSNCKKCNLSVVEENYLVGSLEVEIAVVVGS